MSATDSTPDCGAGSDALASRALSKAEMRVLCLLLEGRTNKEIARMLCRSIRTIEDHRSHVMRKLGVNNPVDMVKKAAAMGLVELPGQG